MTKPPLLRCTGCRSPLFIEDVNTSYMKDCPNCAVSIQAYVFPARFRKTSFSHSGEAIHEEGLSSCFFHPDKKAFIPCERCGRFLCRLCDIEFNGAHVCSSCIERGRQTGQIKNLENHRVLYDNIALALAGYPLLFFILVFWITIVTAPMALFTAIRHWKSPSSLIRSAKPRFGLSILLAFTAWWLKAKFDNKNEKSAASDISDTAAHSVSTVA